MVTILRIAGVSVAAFALSLLFPARSVTHAAASAPGATENRQSAPTFSRDVLPILQKSCQSCHRPGTPAPMSLLTYAEARPWARSIKTKVTNREMPPWHIDRSIGEYSNDPSLSDQEVATIAAWIDAGAPEGNRADAPAPRVFPPSTEWTYGEPDLIVRMEKGFRIPATGPDFIPEEHVDPKLTEDRHVKWVQIIPDAWRAVHHAHVYVDLPEDVDRAALGLNMGSNVGNSMDLIEYGAGNDADIFPDGTSKMLPKGSIFRFEGHYHPYGEEAFDRMRVGVKFYPKGYQPEHVVTSHRIRTGVGNDWVLNRERVEDLLLRAGHKIAIDEPAMPTGALVAENPLHSAAFLSIPPNSVVTHDRYFPLPKPALIISFQPHMHFRGSKMLLEAIHPDGRREILTNATHYEQNWQVTYKYKVPHLFPAGTILHTVSIHDNTANNRHNPDPTAWIGWGSRTMDEMGHGWTDIAFLSDEQYHEELAKRRTRSTNDAPKR
ncbi:MAG: cytochrome c [Acidimicrobiia bacterium]|nr:cytochrome c [Acidimicrobiia bacterium]